MFIHCELWCQYAGALIGLIQVWRVAGDRGLEGRNGRRREGGREEGEWDGREEGEGEQGGGDEDKDGEVYDDKRGGRYLYI